ncbi:MAG: plasmid recombination protein [Methylophaga sp.]|nr:plasmid recombination protein [Methylophaga sp.]
MQKPQFFHVATYPRYASKLKPNGFANTVDKIVQEAIRVPQHCSHVTSPQPPILLTGQPLESLPERLEQLLDREQHEYSYQPGKPRRRAARRDEHVLLVAVYSYGVDKQHVDGKIMHEFFNVCQDFHKRHFGEIDCALLHVDEEFYHIHVYTISANAKKLIPGHQANELRKLDKSSGISYRKAMSELQDRFYDEVASKFDIPRFGPRRERLTRAEYLKSKSDSEKLAASFLEEQNKRLKVIQAEMKAKETLAETQFMERVAVMQDQLSDLESQIHDHESYLGELAQAKISISALTAELIEAQNIIRSYQDDLDDEHGPR